MGRSMMEVLENQELIQKIIDDGLGDFIEVLLLNENKVYTKKGKLNQSGACRALGWKPKQLKDALLRCQELLKDSC